MGIYKNRFIADFIPEGYRIISRNEKVKEGDWFWTNDHYRPVHDFLIGTKTKLTIVRKHEPTQTNNSLMQFGAS